MTDDPNNWADPTVTYLVQVRPPQPDEQFLNGRKIHVADHSYANTAYPVVIGTISNDPSPT